MRYVKNMLDASRELAYIDKRKPRQVNLRRATSTAYYALFHCLAQNCADALAGRSYSNRNTRAWNQAYRALQHGDARKRCQRKGIIGRFSQDIQDFAEVFCEMQAQRHQADYDPHVTLHRSEVVGDIDRVENCVDRFGKASTQDRRTFAIYVLLPLRS